jgi:hypothetical protein
MIKRFAGDRFSGLSTDVKPTNILEGAFFIEVDTGAVYVYSGATWIATPYVLVNSLSSVAFNGDYNSLNNLPDLSLLVSTKQYASTALFPALGIFDRLYIAQDSNKIYRWNGATYTELNVSPVPLTGNSVGDIPQWDGTAWVKTTVANGEILKNTGAGLAPISHTEANRSITPFRRSPFLPPIGSWQSLIAWDNFSTNGALVTSDSGATYVNLVGNGYTVTGNKALANTTGNITGIATGGNFYAQMTCGTTTNLRFYIWKDANNYYEIINESSLGAIIVNKIIAGVNTNVLTTANNTNIPPHFSNQLTYQWGYISGLPTSARVRIYFIIKELPNTAIQINVEADVAIFDNLITHAAFQNRPSPALGSITSFFVSKIKLNNI